MRHERVASSGNIGTARGKRINKGSTLVEDFDITKDRELGDSQESVMKMWWSKKTYAIFDYKQ